MGFVFSYNQKVMWMKNWRCFVTATFNLEKSLKFFYILIYWTNKMSGQMKLLFIIGIFLKIHLFEFEPWEFNLLIFILNL